MSMSNGVTIGNRSYHKCTDGVLGPIIGVDCSSPAPANIQYSFTSFLFLTERSVSTGIPSFINTTLPDGLILDSLTGEIHGTPTIVKSITSYSINAENGGGSASVSISIEIISSLISYPQTNLIIGQGLSFSIAPNLTKVSTISIVSGSLPNGLSINPSTGVISGSPSQLLSSQSVTIEAMSGTVIQTAVLSFTVITPISSFSYSQSSYVLSRDDPVSIIPTVDGDQLSFSVSSGSLPIGLSINSSIGIISGTPLSSIPLTNTIQASNQVGSTQFTISIQVIIPLSNLHYSQFSFTLIKGQSFSISPIISGDNPLFTITSGTLPPGLSLNQSTGIISGIPSSTFPSTSITIQASNQLGFIQTQLSFTVNALSTLTIILISLSILIILIILIIIILSKKKKHTLPKKSIEEVKSVENRIPNPSHSV
ncbi:hypothetical protein WA171_005199 [Blastocystis sp. BT1]